MMATQHAVVQAKAYANTLKRRTANVAKPALRYAPIASCRKVTGAKCDINMSREAVAKQL